MLLKILTAIRVFLFAMFLFLPSLIVLMVTGFWKPLHQYFAPAGVLVLLINMGMLFTGPGKAAVGRGIARITGR